MFFLFFVFFVFFLQFHKFSSGTILVETTRGFVFLGLKSTNHSSLNFDKSLSVSDFIVLTGQ